MRKLIVALVVIVALGAGTYALAGDDGHSKRAEHAKQMRHEKEGKDSREGHGPPPWAPAYGWRCKEAGNPPGSPVFKACIQAKKH
jgi:hypothetical protein